MTNYVRKLLNDAQAAGLQMTVFGGDTTPDYVGHHPAEAEEAINAVEEAELELRGGEDKRVGWALIIDGVEPDERIANSDSKGWISKWCEENIR